MLRSHRTFALSLALVFSLVLVLVGCAPWFPGPSSSPTSSGVAPPSATATATASATATATAT